MNTALLPDLDHQIPIYPQNMFSGGYHHIAVDSADPRQNDPMVLVDQDEIAHFPFHARSDGQNPPYGQPVPGSRPQMYLRAPLIDMLRSANLMLVPFGVELFLLDGHRSLACQYGLWRFYIEAARQRSPQARPDVWEKSARRYALNPARYPDEISCWSAHGTGGAVDLTLRDRATGALLDMGCAYEDLKPDTFNDHFEKLLLQGRISSDDPRLWNRRLLHWAMSAQGFLNDPFVFYHYDFGNQLYVRNAHVMFGEGPDAAWWGPVHAPGDPDPAL